MPSRHVETEQVSYVSYFNLFTVYRNVIKISISRLSVTYIQYPEANAHVQPPVFLPEPPTPRGPPRKPKQSGFALWVGNLPSRANIVDLKDHFSQGATKEIESVFLISNSKCAFVNYRTEAACVSAVARFHDSRFQGIKLVCRMRRGTSELKNRVTLSPPLPAASGTTDSNEIDDSHAELVPNNSSKDSSSQRPAVKYCERYFIVKSLTIEDLERSRVSGVWATQRHNEAFLNHAYEVGKLLYYPYGMNCHCESSRMRMRVMNIDISCKPKIGVPD